LNLDDVTYDYYGITAPLSQNLGSDPLPTFGSAKVNKSGSTYSNSEFRVKAECERGYGSVEGARSYSKGDAVTLTAKPAAGCVFDHFEVKTTVQGKMIGWNGSEYDYPTVTVKTYKEDTIKLTDSIDKCYTVRAVFKIFDDTPPDMKVTVKLELECTNDVGGWNNDYIPVALVDSAGEEHQVVGEPKGFELRRGEGLPYLRSGNGFPRGGTRHPQLRRRLDLPRLRAQGVYLGERKRRRHGKRGGQDPVLSL
jgi:hypothetical protein